MFNWPSQVFVKGYNYLMSKSILLGVSLVLIVWLSANVVRLEKYHYANQVGMCERYKFPEESIDREKCLDHTETRTSFVWHLLYGLNII